MLGNLLMDVNKLSLWKNGAGGWWWRGGCFHWAFPWAIWERERGLTLSVIWTKSLQCISRYKINSICATVLIRQSAIICGLHPPPSTHPSLLTLNDPTCSGLAAELFVHSFHAFIITGAHRVGGVRVSTTIVLLSIWKAVSVAQRSDAESNNWFINHLQVH